MSQARDRERRGDPERVLLEREEGFEFGKIAAELVRLLAQHKCLVWNELKAESAADVSQLFQSVAEACNSSVLRQLGPRSQRKERGCRAVKRRQYGEFRRRSGANHAHYKPCSLVKGGNRRAGLVHRRYRAGRVVN